MSKFQPISITVLHFPQAEWPAIGHLNTLLGAMHDLVMRMDAGLMLYNFSRGQRNLAKEQKSESSFQTFRKWMRIAGRDGAVAVVDLEDAVLGANDAVSGCPSLFPEIDRTKTKAAINLFKQYFPMRRDIRDAASHTVMPFKSKKKIDEHSIVKGIETEHMRIAPGSRTTLSEIFFDRKYTMNFEGGVVSYEVSAESVLKATEIVTTFYQAFPQRFRDLRIG